MPLVTEFVIFIFFLTHKPYVLIMLLIIIHSPVYDAFFKENIHYCIGLIGQKTFGLLAVPASAAAAGILLNACYPYTDCLPSLKSHIYSRLVTPVDSFGDS